MSQHKKEPLLFEFTNEYRTWYCVRYVHNNSESEQEHEKRKLFMYQARVGHAGSDAYRFRDPDDRLLFLIRFGMR